MRQPFGQHGLAVGILQFDRQSQPILGPGDGHSQPKPDGQARMTSREPSHPKGVPSATEDEQFPPDGLNGIGEHRHIDTRTEGIGC